VARVGAPLVEVLRLPGFSLDDLPPDAPEHEVAEGHQSRLGKGIAAIMPGSEPAPPRRRAGGVASIIPLGPQPDDEAAAPARLGPEPAADHPSQVRPALAAVPSLGSPAADDLPPLTAAEERLVERLHGDLVVALLDGLAAVGSPELVAYVHQPDRGTPRLHLGRPGLDALTPDRAYQLFRALDVLGRTRPGVVEPLGAVGFDGVGVVVAGTGSRGLWVVARDGRPLTADEVDAAVAYARGTGSAATLVDRRTCAVTTLPDVQVRVDEGQVQAHVQLSGVGSGGDAGAPTGVEAAARATLAALGSDAEFLYAAAARDGDTAASIVLVRQRGRVGVGAAAGLGEAPALTAAAARRATEHRTS
jgi:hypothetical protein